MSTSVELSRAGLSTDRLIAALEKQLPDTNEVLDNAQAVVLNRIRTRFRKQQSPDGTPWKESISARIRKSGGYTYSNGRKVTGGDTLFATGTLFRSIYAYKKGPNTRAVTFDQSKAPYGEDHQLGKDGQVRRSFIGYGPTDHTAVEAVIQRRFGG